MVNQEVISKIVELYGDLYAHDGYGEIRVELRILRKGQKEVIVHCGKQYRFILDVDSEEEGVYLNQVKKGLQQLEINNQSIN